MTNQAVKKGFWPRFRYGLFLLAFTWLAAEILLRIFNPFHLRLKGDRIVLPVNQKLTIDNHINPRLDPVITHTRNSLGFRGPEWPAQPDQYFKVITVGGSTTACHFLDDTKTWPFLLSQQLKAPKPVWLDNAGLDGHSTFGHEILLNDHLKKLHPDLILFLTGINDIENDQPSFHDKLSTKGAYTDLKHFIFENSEVLNLLLNLSRGWKAQKLNNTSSDWWDPQKQETLVLSDTIIKQRLLEQEPYLAAYRKRLSGLIDTCIANGIRPVMLTQPMLPGIGKDPVNGVDLETIQINDKLNGKLDWLILEKYNEVLRTLCREKQVKCIDLAALMPRDSRYYYDKAHFTNEGAAVVAGIVSREW